ncbi:MAG: carbohydrate-binding domain-containing protein, partial [Ruminococcus callidus]|nr:carbohydrate-binding domain-containing protein [Ruminococcus callidus]
TMSGGSCTIDSTDHAVHAAGTALFSGTTLEITSDNKGISSHGDLEISGGDITIHSCTEGVESKAEMTISGGNVRILDASDDGLNTGGSDSGSYAMTITGGYIYVNASGDGVDSNSTWEMSGGTLLVCGPTSGGDGSLDANGNMTYTGGTLLALSSKGMMEYPESGCLIATNCNAAAGEQISIVDKNGTVLVTLQSPKAVSDVIYGIGDSDSADYTIVTGGTYDGTLNEDGYGEGGSVSGGTEVTANGGTGSMNGGAPAGGGRGGAPNGAPNGGQGGTPPEMPNSNNSGGNIAS